MRSTARESPRGECELKRGEVEGKEAKGGARMAMVETKAELLQPFSGLLATLKLPQVISRPS